MTPTRVLRGAYRRIPDPPHEDPTMHQARIESYTTYYATCPTCHWNGPDRESDERTATRDADTHECDTPNQENGGDDA